MIAASFFVMCLTGLTLVPQPSTAQSKAYELMLKGLLDFSVDTITAADARSIKGVVFLDAREPGEYSVSHIKGARNVGYDHFETASVADIPRSSVIIVYCSVGYRSEKVAEKLKASGYRNVKNLYGGIFEWVNEGFPVHESAGKVTERVHGYSPEWGVWLNRGERVYE